VQWYVDPHDDPLRVDVSRTTEDSMNTTTSHTRTAHRRAGHTSIAGGTALGVALAWAATSLVFVLGNLGAPIRVVTGWAPDGADLSIAEYLVTSAVAVMLGGALLWWLDRRRDGWRAWTITVALVSLGSALPLWWLEVDTGSKMALTCMHLVTGAAAVAGQSVRRNRSIVRSHAVADAAAS
jgi:Family of unknown function (DUF6069)